MNEDACPACGAPAGAQCTVRVDGVEMSGWSHDLRILAPILDDLGARP